MGKERVGGWFNRRAIDPVHDKSILNRDEHPKAKF